MVVFREVHGASPFIRHIRVFFEYATMSEGPLVTIELVQDAKPAPDAQDDAQDAKSAQDDAEDAKSAHDDAEDAKSVHDDAKSVQEDAKDAKSAQDDAKDAKSAQDDAKDAKSVQDDAKDVKSVQDDAKDAKSVQDDAKDAKSVQDDAKDAKSAEDDAKDAMSAYDDAEDAKSAHDAKPAHGGKKRKNTKTSSAVEKRGKKTMRAWLIDCACTSKEDITCFDLQMSDTFDQLKNGYFAPDTTLQMVVVDYKQTGQKKKNMVFCFDEEGVYNCKQNVVMAGICREIWPDPQSNPFSHGAFGSFVLYYSGSVSGAPSSDMPPVATIDDFIERLCECN